MDSIVKVLVKRDGMSEDEATAYVEDEMKCIRDMIGEGDFSGAEEQFASVFGLEPDYMLGALV